MTRGDRHGTGRRECFDERVDQYGQVQGAGVPPCEHAAHTQPLAMEPPWHFTM